MSGNPPFYDDADEDDSDNRDKNLFLKILSGDYEFDSPYWDDISDSGKKITSQLSKIVIAIVLWMPPVISLCLTAKNLVASLMEVDQDQRLTAQEAIAHEWYG